MPKEPEEDLFGDDMGSTEIDTGPAPEPEEEPKEPDVQPEPEPEPEPEAEPEPEEPEATDEGEGGGEPEPEAASAEGDEPSHEEEQQLPRSALKELQKLRKERADRRRLERSQGPPQPVPVPQQTQAEAVPMDRINVQYDEDGNPFVDTQMLQGVLSKAFEPSPEQQAATILKSMEQDFVMQNPARNGPAVKRFSEAREYLEIRSEELSEELGYQPNGLQGWMQAMEVNGLTAEFKTLFPEVGDVRRFTYGAFFADGEGRLMAMDDYASWMEKATPDVDADPPPQLDKLPSGRPRSMAKKGTSGGEGVTEESELQALHKKANVDPMGFTEEDQTRMERIAKKLGIIDLE